MVIRSASPSTALRCSASQLHLSSVQCARAPMMTVGFLNRLTSSNFAGVTSLASMYVQEHSVPACGNSPPRVIPGTALTS